MVQLLALVLLLGAAALLAVSIISGVITWAWGSVALSAMAAVALVVHRVQRRSARRRYEQYQRRRHDVAAVVDVDDDGSSDGTGKPCSADPSSTPTGDTGSAEVDESDVADVGAATDEEPSAVVIPADEIESGATAQLDAAQPNAAQPDATQPEKVTPAEEDTDAADLLLVVGLEDEVVVEDEYPRYHVAGCRTLSRETEGLPLREARELGFTPCAQCGPDATVAAAHRSRS